MALDVTKPTGKLGVLIPGAEAVGGTFIAGFQTIKQGTSTPIGSAIDSGVFKCRNEFFEVLEKAGKRGEYSQVDTRDLLIRRRELGAADVENRFWINIDEREALSIVKRTTFYIKRVTDWI